MLGSNNQDYFPSTSTLESSVPGDENEPEIGTEVIEKLVGSLAPQNLMLMKTFFRDSQRREKREAHEKLEKKGVHFDGEEEEDELEEEEQEEKEEKINQGSDIKFKEDYDDNKSSTYRERSSTSLEETKPVKIKPMDKGLVLKVGDDIDRFI
ncbi:hypothetical protein CROQUDRAFT_90503 [Cronartium quercuum f. sp. fusiforme G11]|uniref:Uncharacterized protein n=1 Tax=Cronartium quercuum f. sp. fusiforme G11 TaxID=708437 RepID=A0A9P6NJV9_9BASI|nr:hypothetical protein CROQUDRAFT_90503 [Cronartium quercuum f. sp. fusiforme G11]